MSSKPTTIFVCNNIDCRNRGADAVLQAMQARAAGQAFDVRPYLCFSACNSGPNVVIADRQCWLSGVQPQDVEDIFAYLAGGAPPARLQGKNDPELEKMIFDIINAGLMPDAG